MDYKETYFYKKYKPMLDEFVNNGGDVDTLGKKDYIYNAIKDYRLLDENGNRVDVETKFSILGHERKRVRVKDSKQALTAAVDEFLAKGGSFHMPRKSLPFYPLLHSYADNLKLKGIHMSYEDIMKSLGYVQYSDTYYRCMGLEGLSSFRDKDGYVDSYKKNNKMKNYIETLADYYDIPYFLIIGLVCEEKQKRIVMRGDFLGKLKQDLLAYIERNDNLKGLKTNDKELYLRVVAAKKLLSDGSGTIMSSKDVLTVLGIEGVEHNLSDKIEQDLNIEDIMQEIKSNYDGNMVILKNIEESKYRKICKKANSMGIYVSDLFEMYGMKCNGLNLDRLSRIYLKEIPYIDEMLARKHEIIEQSGISLKNGHCKEEVMEININVCKQVFEEYKDKIYGSDVEDDLKVD